jgi:hypothetical protein
MPRTPAQDTPARRKLKVIDAVTRQLDPLEPGQVERIIDWMDGLVDGDPESVEAEIRAMRRIAGQFATLDSGGRESAVRWVNENYAKPANESGDGPIPL